MKIVTLLHQTYNGHDDVLGVYEDNKDALEMIERHKKRYVKSPFRHIEFWLEEIDLIPSGGLVDE